jgi:hypothetical protein
MPDSRCKTHSACHSEEPKATKAWPERSEGNLGLLVFSERGFAEARRKGPGKGRGSGRTEFCTSDPGIVLKADVLRPKSSMFIMPEVLDSDGMRLRSGNHGYHIEIKWLIQNVPGTSLEVKAILASHRRSFTVGDFLR